MRHCSITDCGSKPIARGWCSKHYTRWQVHGNPEHVVRHLSKTLAESLEHYSTQVGDCLIWTGTMAPGGYGHLSHKGKTRIVHRLVWITANGPLAPGLVVDHKCHNRACINIKHLRAITQKQNTEHRKGANRNSTTGALGVYWSSKQQRYRAQVYHLGKNHYVGTYKDLAEASEAVAAKRRELFTHNEHDK